MIFCYHVIYNSPVLHRPGRDGHIRRRLCHPRSAKLPVLGMPHTMESNERSPLIATVVVAAPRQRYRHNIVCRTCTFILVCALVAVTVVFVFGPRYLSHCPHHREPNGLSFKALQDLLLHTLSEEMVREWSKYYTSGPHLAGKNYSQAQWTQERWEEFGIKAEIVAYDTYLNYPLGHRLALYDSGSAAGLSTESRVKSWRVKFEASLEEDILEPDFTTGLENQVPTFHGYLASGNVTASFVFVNYSTFQDYEDLIRANVSLKGKIAVAKYSRIFRGLKVKRA